MENKTEQNLTTIYLIRHAEKKDDTKNTDLSQEGFERAENWKKYFEKIPIDTFYSSGFQRARHTCQPIAFSRDKDISIYKNHLMNLKEVIEENKGKTVLIVGHSNRIPTFINSLLGEEKYPEILETEFGNLYIIKELDNKISTELIVPIITQNATI